jgi:hypothetical protein
MAGLFGDMAPPQPQQQPNDPMSLLRMFMSMFAGGGPQSVGANSLQPPADPRLQQSRANADAMNNLQAMLGPNADYSGILNLLLPNLPPTRRIQQSFKQFPGY